MRQWIFVVSAILIISVASGAPKSNEKDSAAKTLDKASEKTYPKKVTSLKKRPTKSPNYKSPLEAFKDLPQDDLEFIKELDKQFKLHGDKIKIKVERDNSTLKNSKRTVDGDLGYGYYNGQQSAGYDYPKPSFTFYPYSQQDIPASAPGYHIQDEEQSTVSIIPSLSYEIKQTSHGGYESNAPFIPSQPDPEQGSYHEQQGGQGLGHGYQHNEPVIVLRIPGPTKYASHLQVLLQQYLEIRAAQYIKILEEVELQKQQQQHQQVEQLQYEQVPDKSQEEHYHHQQEEVQQNYGYAEQQEVNYPSIDDVYQRYKGRHQETRPIEEEQYEGPQQYAQQPEQYAQQQGGHDEQQQQQYYYSQLQQEQPAHASAVEQGYQPIYYVAMPQQGYEQQNSNAPSVPQGYVDDGHLPIAENNPRNTHTKVLFTESDNKDHSTQYPLPSIKPFERHAPTPSPAAYESYQGDQQGESGEYQQQQQQHEYQLHGQASNSDSVVSITQRPYNYHAHTVRNKKRSPVPAPTTVAPGENLKKLHTLINRLRTPEGNTSTRIKKEAV